MTEEDNANQEGGDYQNNIASDLYKNNHDLIGVEGII